MQQLKKKYLTKKQAEQRFDQIEQKSIYYQLFIRLNKGVKYKGTAIINLRLNHLRDDLLIEYSNNDVLELIVNNKRQDDNIVWNSYFLQISKDLLKSGNNEIIISFEGLYNYDSTGMSSYLDYNQNQYLYTQFEPNLCNNFCPIFDQPDLKIYFTLTAMAPQDWLVLSNQNSQQIDCCEMGQYKIHKFPQTKLLPCYTLAIAAGPLKKITSKEQYNNISISLYCRDIIYDQLNNQASFIIWLIKQTLKQCELYFGYQYPFNKLDFLFCKNFSQIAMENSGLITFIENILDNEQQFYELILHEIIHQWFGNLVTPKWWNDLWLNEGFAVYFSVYLMSKIALQNQDIFQKQINQNYAIIDIYSTSSWNSFFIKKQNCLINDKDTKFNHPINMDIKDTLDIESIFDSIIYNKGAAVLCQLFHLFGEQLFFAITKKYLCYNSFENVSINQYFEFYAIEYKKAKQYYANLPVFSLFQWKKQWIDSIGYNILEQLFNPLDKSQNAVLQIRQTPKYKIYPTLRYHYIKVYFFEENLCQTEMQYLVQPQTITELKYDGSQKQFAAVLIDVQAITYANIIIDQVSKTFLVENRDKIKNQLILKMMETYF